jgi:hypothetical protein
MGYSFRLFVILSLVIAMVGLLNCGGATDTSGGGGGSSGSGDWYYHWNCHGDSECLSTNPNGQAIGNLNEGPAKAACTGLLQFAAHFWGSAATNSCDQLATGAGGGGGSSCDLVCALQNGPNKAAATTYWNIRQGSGELSSFSKFALYGDGTGQLFANGLNVSTPIVLPSVQSFTWTKLSANAILIANLAESLIYSYSSVYPHLPRYYLITSLTITSGGVPSAMFASTVACNSSTGDPCDFKYVDGSLVSGTFDSAVLFPLGSSCSSNNQCGSDICSCYTHKCESIRYICE